MDPETPQLGQVGPLVGWGSAQWWTRGMGHSGCPPLTPDRAGQAQGPRGSSSVLCALRLRQDHWNQPWGHRVGLRLTGYPCPHVKVAASLPSVWTLVPPPRGSTALPRAVGETVGHDLASGTFPSGAQGLGGDRTLQARLA